MNNGHKSLANTLQIQWNGRVTNHKEHWLTKKARSRDGNGGKSKSLQVEFQGLQKAPGGAQEQYPLWRSGGKAPWIWRFFFLNLRYEKPSILALYPVSNTHSLNPPALPPPPPPRSLLCFKAVFQRNKPVNTSYWGSGSKTLWSWKPFLNHKYENPHFLAYHPISNSHSQNTLYCALSLRLSFRVTNQSMHPVGAKPPGLKLKAFF